jgi:mono/diheme cytochrome c family protein
MKTIVVACAIAVLAAASAHAAESGNSDEAKHLALAPVQLKYKDSDRAKIARGSYLANALGGCVSCHTFPTFDMGGDPFKGEPEKINAKNYLAGGRCFGPFKSPNLTPDAKGRPAGLSLAQFKESLRSGKMYAEEDKHHEHGPGAHQAELQQVMPWPELRNMTDEDIEAVYAFLSAVPHADAANTNCAPPKAPK